MHQRTYRSVPRSGNCHQRAGSKRYALKRLQQHICLACGDSGQHRLAAWEYSFEQPGARNMVGMHVGVEYVL
jgi:hypothetical protein